MRSTASDMAVTILGCEQRCVARSQVSAVQASPSAHAASLVQSSTSVSKDAVHGCSPSSPSPPQPPSLLTVAVLVILPVALATTTTVTVARLLVPSAPRLQMTGAAPLHVPWLALADTNVVPAGGMSVRTTPVSALTACTVIV